MSKYYNHLSEKINSFVKECYEERIKLTDEANALADEARSLIARIQDNAARHEALVAIMGAAADDTMSNYNGADVALNNIKDALKDFIDNDIPECKVEVFEGYCEYCGEELTTDTINIGKNGNMICTDCAIAEDEAEEVLAEE